MASRLVLLAFCVGASLLLVSSGQAQVVTHIGGSIRNGDFNSTSFGWQGSGIALAPSGGQGGGGDNYVRFGAPGITISQTVYLARNITLSFYVRSLNDTTNIGDKGISFRVVNLLTNAFILSGFVQAVANGWGTTPNTFTVNDVTSGNYAIAFEAGPGVSSSQLVGLDSVVLTEAPAPMVGGGALSLFAGGLLLLARRRRWRK